MLNTNKGPESCKYFQTCSANLCPLDPMLKQKVWYADENLYDEICRNRDYMDRQFIITQKKISRVRSKLEKQGKSVDGLFTYSMLNRDFVVSKGIQGIDPDPPDFVERKEGIKLYYDRKEKLWLKHHPEITFETKQRQSEWGKNLGKTVQKRLKRNGLGKMVSITGNNAQHCTGTSQKSKRIEEVKTI